MSDRNDGEFEVFDPYEDLMDLSGGENLPDLEDPTLPPANPPRSPLLTGLIVGLLLVVLSIAAFQLIGQEDDGDAQYGIERHHDAARLAPRARRYRRDAAVFIGPR